MATRSSIQKSTDPSTKYFQPQLEFIVKSFDKQPFRAQTKFKRLNFGKKSNRKTEKQQKVGTKREGVIGGGKDERNVKIENIAMHNNAINLKLSSIKYNYLETFCKFRRKSRNYITLDSFLCESFQCKSRKNNEHNVYERSFC